MKTKPSLTISEFKIEKKEKLKGLEEELAQTQKEVTICNKRNLIYENIEFILRHWR